MVCGHLPGDRGDETLLQHVLKAAARPTLVVPERSPSGRAVVVGYDGSREAAKALSSLAASGLGADRPIYVVSCHVDVSESAADCTVACRFLGRHGLASTACPEASGEDPAQILLDCCRRYEAGLLVAGAFGHSTLREYLFGSTTRELLRRLPLPVLLDR
jgi:nucleotide-binding universal stress UspA family protein